MKATRLKELQVTVEIHTLRTLNVIHSILEIWTFNASCILITWSKAFLVHEKTTHQKRHKTKRT